MIFGLGKNGLSSAEFLKRLALRKVLDTPDAYDILIAVKNFSTQPVEVPLQVTALLRQDPLEQINPVEDKATY